MATDNGGASQLPKDVIVEILSWMPVKALLRFKCVCKSWSAVVTSSYFISKHINNYYNKSYDGCLLAHIWGNECELFPDETLEDLSHQPFHLPFPAAICGPCNGIYYLDTGLYTENAIWNPATKELRRLPAKLTEPNLPPFPDVPGFDLAAFLLNQLAMPKTGSIETGLPPYLNRILDAYGFGFDAVTEDYKVVVVRHLFDHSRGDWYHPSSVILYSLRTNSWIYWGELEKNCLLLPSLCYPYVNGVFYWLGLRSVISELLILSFDFNKDSFKEIPMPDYPKQTYREDLAMYHDSIALFMIHIVEKFVDIWVIDDEGFWTKKFTIAPLLEIERPVGCWKNGEIFLLSGSSSRTAQLFLCDPSTLEVRDLGFQSSTSASITQLLVYKESLVSIKEMKCLQHEEQ